MNNLKNKIVDLYQKFLDFPHFDPKQSEDETKIIIWLYDMETMFQDILEIGDTHYQE